MNHGNQETFEFENQKNYLLDGLKTEEFSLEELNQEMIGLSSELIQLHSNHSFEQRNIDNLPIEKERELSSINENYLSQNSEVENYANAVHIKIENGQLPYSLENMKERISLFLEGWGDYLHNKFSNKVAIEFSESARNQKEEWLMNKTTGLIISKAA